MYPATGLNPLFQFVFLGLILLPAILYLLTLQNTLKVISPENRFMSLGQVWLMFIPFFNIVWQFIMVNRLAKSIGAECVRLNILGKGEKPTGDIGLAMCICNCLVWIPFLGALASLVAFISHWVKVAEYKRLMAANPVEFLLDAEQNIFYGDRG